jgi:hypothetical protein
LNDLLILHSEKAMVTVRLNYYGLAISGEVKFNPRRLAGQNLVCYHASYTRKLQLHRYIVLASWTRRLAIGDLP